jgi:hypothetical protein
MKRKIASLLAVCMLLQTPASMLTAFGGSMHDFSPRGQRARKASGSNVQASSSNTKFSESSGDQDGMGTLKLEMKNFLGTRNCRLSAFLEPSESTARKQELLDGLEWVFVTDWESTDGSIGQSYEYEMSDIPEGSYRLTLEGTDEPGAYLTYSQDIKIKSQTITTLYLANDYPEYYGYAEETTASKQKMGVLMAGNFTNGDQAKEVIDEADLEVMLDAVYEGETNSLCDLNGDGIVDLKDLEIFSKFYNNKEKRKAKAIDRTAITMDDVEPIANPADGSKVDQEDVIRIFSNVSTGEEPSILSASPKNEGQSVSDSNSVTVAAEFREPITARGFAVAPPMGSGSAMEDGEISFISEDGKEYVAIVKNGKQVGDIKLKGQFSPEQPEKKASPSQLSYQMMALSTEEETPLSEEKAVQGKTIVIDLGKQIPVKQVTIRITKTVASTNLAEISSVKFLNNMEDHIPVPDLSIPDKLAGEPGDAEFTVSWRRQANVTGYDVYVKGETDKGEIKEQVFEGITDTSHLVAKLDESELINNKAYTVKVRSVNDDWRSDYSEAITIIPEAAEKPKPPEQIQVVGGYQKLTVSWKKMKSTDSYTLYYREKANTNGEFSSISGITETKAEITGLKDDVTYEIYMTGTNRIGTSGPSRLYSGTTLILEAPITPNFKLLNVPNEGGGPSQVIASVENHVSDINLCSEEFAVVDGRYETAWVRKDWDAGCVYPAENKAPVITFDQPYEMDTIVIIPDYEQTYGYNACKVYYWDADGAKKTADGTILTKRDAKGKIYYEFTAKEKFTAKKIQVTVSATARRISYAELKFYQYHDLKERIFNLYTDDLHMVLRTEVTKEQIQQLYEELEYVDPVSNEKTPHYDLLKLEIDTAMKLLEQGVDGADVIRIDPKLAARQDGHTGFIGGLNTWQPIGITGLAGDKVIIYAGGEKKTQGESTSLEVIATQYHSESSNLFQSLGQLRIGPNELTIPKITSMADAEAGGQLYIRYNGNYNAEQYAVRVEIPTSEEGKTSAAKIPVLNVFGVTDEERSSRIEAYVNELEQWNSEEMHTKYHSSSELSYDEKNCIFGATDIAGNKEMFSLPVKGILAGLTRSDRTKAEVLDDTLTAMDEMLTLFYQHKGLSDDPEAGVKNRMPVSRINIRYQRMFEGAFMYAGGAHIGIEWGSASGMMAGRPLEVSQGQYVSGNYFGWGIGHEIGHEINEGAYAVAEVTNNYYALLAQEINPGYGGRWSYPSVYKKVTSGAKGPSSNGAVQLAMYWQLHLAYDTDPHFTTYDSYKEQFDSLFFARMDSYARDAASAPKPGGVSLSLNGDKDNNLMRLACAAAKMDVLDFFRRWGMEPDSTTQAYADQFNKKETRAIWLSSDTQWEYVLANPQPDDDTQSSIKIEGSVSYSETDGNGNEVMINLNQDGSDGEFLGYEVFRCEWKGDTYTRRPVCFVPAEESSATDTIATVNNRAFTYEAVGYDIWLRPTSRIELGTVRVSHNGGLSSQEMTADTNMITVDAIEDEEPSDEYPDAVEKKDINFAVDGDNDTTFTGYTKKGETPEIILHLNREEILTGLEYRLKGSGNPIGAFEIYISQDGTTWKKAATEETSFALKDVDGVKVQQIIFSSEAKEGEGRELCSYEASMVKLTAPGQAENRLSVSEIILIGQTGDKIDLNSSGIGYLKENYVNSQDGAVLIPEGSLIFTGTYAGNAAYNTVLLWDEEGTIAGGTNGTDLVAKQIIFAEDPGDGDLRDIRDGIWVYYIEPNDIPEKLPAKVRGELYRVNNAMDQTGQRLVSSTIFVELPDVIPEISLQGAKGE